MTIPYIDSGGTGEELVFLHANGYPPECYRPLLSQLAENNHVLAVMQRPLWPGSKPSDLDNWIPLSDDFLRYLNSHDSRATICVGHSMGGVVLLRATLHEPERFKAIVLLDPVLFPPYFIRVWQVLRKLKLLHRFHPLISVTQYRQREFNDLKRYSKGLQRKSIFKYFDEEALSAYVNGIVRPKVGGRYLLSYSVEWETRMYLTSVWRDMELWRGLPMLEVPTLIIRGEESEVFWEGTGKLVKRKQPKIRVEALEKSTHLVPLERPKEVSTLIQSFSKEIV